MNIKHELFYKKIMFSLIKNDYECYVTGQVVQNLKWEGHIIFKFID